MPFSLNEKIDELYEILKKEVLGNEKIKTDKKAFYDFISRDELRSKCTDDTHLIKLSVLSSHTDWEYVYKCKINNTGELLGECVRDLIFDACADFKVSLYELELLRNEVIYSIDEYSKLLVNLKEWKEYHRKHKNYISIRGLAEVYLKLHRKNETEKCLDMLSNYLEKDFLAPIDYVMLKSRMYEDIYEYDDIIELDELKKIIKLFEENEEHNKIFGIYEHASYLEYWLMIIEKYLNELEDQFEGDEELCLERYSEIYQHYEVGLRYSELINSGDIEILEIMKLHDRIILEIITINVDPFRYSPIFRGTKINMNRLLVNYNFPEKLDYYLNFDDIFSYSCNSISHTRFDINPNYTMALKEKLRIEFPQYKYVIDIFFVDSLLEHQTINFEMKDIISSLLPYYQHIKGGNLLENYKGSNMNEECITNLVRSYLYDKNEEDALNVAVYCIQNNGTLKCNLYNVVDIFYHEGFYESFSEIAQIFIDKEVKKVKVDSCGEIECLLQSLAESYCKTGNNHKISELLKFYETNTFGLNIESYSYEDIREMLEEENI